MNTQNTPVHIRLWHKHFWCLALAYLLLSVALYSFIPSLPSLLACVQGASVSGVSLSIVCFGLGILLSGGFCNFLVQRFRRNKVCIYSILILIMLLAAHYYIMVKEIFIPLWMVSLLRLGGGAAFGMAQMVLSGILAIDVCESYNRTEANYSMSWFFRLGLSLGPVAGILCGIYGSAHVVLLFAMSALALASVLIMSVSFPFRAPDDDVRLFSFDRFFLPQGWLLSLNLFLFSAAVGMVFAVAHNIEFYSMLTTGFLMSLLAQRFVFADAELKSEVVSGLMLVFAALLIQVTRNMTVVEYVVPVMMGLGIGLVSGRFLLFFIKLSRHCQRGTSQSTYNVSWEVGLWTGFAVGYMLSSDDFQTIYNSNTTCVVALGIIAVTLVLYNFATHKWYLLHKNR